MKKITEETPCKICGCGIVVGNMAQVSKGYVCEECVLKMANSDLVEVDASQPASAAGTNLDHSQRDEDEQNYQRIVGDGILRVSRR